MGRAQAITQRATAPMSSRSKCGRQLLYPTHRSATPDDLAEARRLVEKEDRSCLAVRTDARDLASLGDLAESTLGELGRVDAWSLITRSGSAAFVLVAGGGVLAGEHRRNLRWRVEGDQRAHPEDE